MQPFTDFPAFYDPFHGKLTLFIKNKKRNIVYKVFSTAAIIKWIIKVLYFFQDFCEIRLIAHPLYWAQHEFSEKGLYELKVFRDKADMDTNKNEKVESVKWKYNYKPVDEKNCMVDQDKQMFIVRSSEAGEYTCTVKLHNKPTQLYTFHILFLSE